MTRPKVIAMTLLAVLAVLGSASVVFAPNGGEAPSLQLTPTSGCPGQQIVYVINLDAAGAPATVGGAFAKLTSYPDGLISMQTDGFFTVGDSVCAGDYVVTAELAVVQGVGLTPQTITVSTHFTVGDQGCPNLPSCLQPVGGVVMPTNTLAITAPYLALAGLIAVVSAVVVIKKRRD